MTQSTLKMTNPGQFRGRVEVCVGGRYVIVRTCLVAVYRLYTHEVTFHNPEGLCNVTECV